MPPQPQDLTVADVDKYLQISMQQKLFSGASCVASVNGRIFHQGVYGHLLLPPQGMPVIHETLFDLASLTKPLATSLAVMWLLAHGRLSLSSTVAEWLKDFTGAPWRDITVSMLLGHLSGLPATFEAWDILQQADAYLLPTDRVLGTSKAQVWLREQLRRLPFLHPPGVQVLYSDLGFVLLGWLVEAVTQKPLHTFVSQTLYMPLKLADTLLFMPLATPRFANKRAVSIAATELCGKRHRLIQGEVHDYTAWAVGGVAGHAGLFGTGMAVWQLAQQLLLCYLGDAHFFHTGTLKRFWTKSNFLSSTYTFGGWDTPNAVNSTAGNQISRSAVGHLGFTGTAVWIDPKNNFVGVLLTNSAYPSPEGKKPLMNKLRAHVFDSLIAHAR